MKSYNHLWEKFIADENIELAIHNAAKGKKRKGKIEKYLNDPDFPKKIKAYAENFKNAPHKPKIIYDGIQKKKRVIIVPTFKEQVIHHMAVNVLKPIFLKSFYYHSYGSIPGKGCHRGMKAIKRWIATDYDNCKYCLKMDIRKYFESIPHDIYLTKLRVLIHDERFYNLIAEITSVVDKGIPLGFYLSQWTANWYLTSLDHYITGELRAPHYIRLMDDMVVFARNKKQLHEIKNKIEKYLDTIGLQLKDNWQIFPFNSRPLDFMGFRFYKNKITLRKSILCKASRKARRMWKSAQKTIHSMRQMLSYIGWLSSTDTYGFFLRNIKPFVDIRKCKHKISIYDRRINHGLADSTLKRAA